MNREAARPADETGFAAARARMVREQLADRGIVDPATLAAMRIVPREAFVPQRQRRSAYDDRALSIGRGQTISQPYMVAVMTQSLGFADLDWPWTGTRPRFLDVGTGSGYQAAVLAQLGADVVSIERDPTLAHDADERLRGLGYDVEVIVADGSVGAPDRAPFAGVVVGAAAPAVPPPLVAQLRDGARLVVPVGSRASQRLAIVRRRGEQTSVSHRDPCVFVPLVGSHGHPG